MKPAQSTKEISATRQSGSDISTDLHNKSLKNHFKNPDSPKDGERERERQITGKELKVEKKKAAIATREVDFLHLLTLP